MNIDEKDLEILARGRAKVPGAYSGLTFAGFGVFMLGGALFLSGIGWGILVALLSFAPIAVGVLKTKRFMDDFIKEFKEYYERNGDLPPRPVKDIKEKTV